MNWTRPTWAIGFDLVAYGLAVLAVVIAAGMARAFGW